MVPVSLSGEDRKLDEISHEDLEGQTNVFSFDVDVFDKRLSLGEHWHKLLQAHLYFDHIVTLMLREALKEPGAIRLGRMSFVQKLELACAMGLLTKEIAAAIDFVNRIRNKIAHQLDYEVSEKDVLDLKNCTPTYVREALRDWVEAKGRTLDLGHILKALVIQTEIFRQRNEYGRLVEKKAQIRLQVVLDCVNGDKTGEPS